MNKHKINPVRSKSPKAAAAPLVRTSNGVNAVIFDLGNVLIDFDHRIASQKLSKFTQKPLDEIFELLFDSEVTSLFEEGRISPLQFFSKVKEILELKLDYDKFLPIWNEIFFFTGKNCAVFNIAVRLKEQYKTAVLSNINTLHFEFVRKTFPLLTAIQTITSFELKLRKPQAQIYQKALEILKASPQKVFYTDDRLELVEAAAKLGIHSFVFKGIDQLKKDLTEAGISIN